MKGMRHLMFFLDPMVTAIKSTQSNGLLDLTNFIKNIDSNTIVNIVTILLSFAGIFITLYLYNTNLDNRLVDIKNKVEGRLTKEQAKALLEFYFELVSYEFLKQIKAIPGQDDLKKLLKMGNDDELFETIENRGKLLIRKTRGKFSDFILVDNQDFEEFLNKANPLQTNIIEQVRDEEIRSLIKNGFENYRSSDDFNDIFSAYNRALEKVGALNSQIASDMLLEVYKKSR